MPSILFPVQPPMAGRIAASANAESSQILLLDNMRSSICSVTPSRKFLPAGAEAPSVQSLSVELCFNLEPRKNVFLLAPRRTIVEGKPTTMPNTHSHRTNAEAKDYSPARKNSCRIVQIERTRRTPLVTQNAKTNELVKTSLRNDFTRPYSMFHKYSALRMMCGLKTTRIPGVTRLPLVI